MVRMDTGEHRTNTVLSLCAFKQNRNPIHKTDKRCHSGWGLGRGQEEPRSLTPLPQFPSTEEHSWKNHRFRSPVIK